MSRIRNARAERVYLVSWIVFFTILAFIWLWVISLFFASDEILGTLILGSINQSKDAWQDNYLFWATLAFLISTISTFGWFFLACVLPDRGPGENSYVKWPWYGILLLNVFFVIIFIFINQFNDAEWLCALFFFLIGCIGFWFSTAIATPAPFTYVLPLSRPLIHLFPLVRR